MAWAPSSWCGPLWLDLKPRQGHPRYELYLSPRLVTLGKLFNLSVLVGSGSTSREQSCLHSCLWTKFSCGFSGLLACTSTEPSLQLISLCAGVFSLSTPLTALCDVLPRGEMFAVIR